MVGAIELVQNKKTKEPFAPSERTGYQIYKKGLKDGIILRPLGDIIYLFLPLCINKTELETILEKTGKVINNFDKR